MTVIEGDYLRDILDQPRALAATERGLEVTPALAAVAGRLARGGYARVVLTGMGSSLHALHPLYLDLIGHRVPAVMAETSELVADQARRLDPPALVVAVSQSGASAETVRLLGLLPAGTDVIGVTNTADSPLAARSTAAVVTRAGPEATVSCKTYLAGLMALSWTGAVLTGADPDAARADWKAAAPAAARYLETWRETVAALADELRGVRSLFLAGRGASLAAAGTGGLTLKESARVHAEGMSAPAFRHGPLEMLADDVFVGVFLGNPRAAGLNRRLFADVVAAGGRAALIADGGPGDPFAHPAVPDRVRPAAEMLPVQMISLALAALRGREAGRFERASKVTTTE
jgi:glucosamine--fructose-6-phosphate aminotransferase (isomerizing)